MIQSPGSAKSYGNAPFFLRKLIGQFLAIFTLLILSIIIVINTGHAGNDGDGYTIQQGDCNDSDAAIYPGAEEICGDGVDQDCNGDDLPCEPVDEDGDGSPNFEDCNDTDASIHPGAEEICGDGVDQDCNGDDLSCEPVDADGDGYPNFEDCNDSDAAIRPGAEEICDDGIDQDCNGDDLSCEAMDEDGDGFQNFEDCNDTDASIHPEAEEICEDGIDQDCNGEDLPCGAMDEDGDGFVHFDDCNDTDAAIYPGAEEICGDEIDQNCDGFECEPPVEMDNDSDGFVDLPGEDCNDADETIHPGAKEICGDGIDQNCDGADLACESPVDEDGDGFTGLDGDCNDGDAAIHPDADEIECDAIDQNCDGSDFCEHVDDDGYNVLEESVYPAIGRLDEDLQITISGEDFDQDTKVFMSLSTEPGVDVVGAVDTPGFANSVAVADATAYVADGSEGLQIIHAADPGNPIIIGSIATPGVANGVAVLGNTAYVADGASGLQIIDISDPASLVITGSVDTPGSASHVAVSGTTAYVADGTFGLQIIDVTNPASPTIIGSVDTPGGALTVAVSGTTAYVADQESGLQIIDVTNPASPAITGSVDTPGSALGVAISGTTAYVADGANGLQIIDVTNPASPTIIGSVDTTDAAASVSVKSSMAYVADQASGLQIIDISDPTAPAINDTMDTPGSAQDMALSGGAALVADFDGGVAIVPVPVEIETVVVNSDTSMTCTLPRTAMEGDYTLRVINDAETDEMDAAVSFLDSTDLSNQTQMKAIIVAGGGNYAGNTLWPSTRLVANQAYKTLVSQGYSKDNIYYLGPHSVDLYPDDGITNDVDAPATSSNLKSAITTWATDASELFLFMTDHGKQATFQLNANERYFPAKQLDTWLDSLQATMTGRVVCVYDACNSGSFIPLLTPPTGMERIVISSSKADERAWFMNQGINSFSYQFWSSVWLKGNLYDAYVDARDMMALDQTALLDADGDGIATTKTDKTKASTILIGRGRSAASLPPGILAVSDNLKLTGSTQASLWARMGSDALETIDKVWAVVVPPGHATAASNIPVTALPSIDLVDSDGDGTFTGQYSGFSQQGTYRVIVYTKDTGDLYSQPKSFKVEQLGGSSSAVDSGYMVTKDLWAKAVLEVTGSPVTLVWKLVGADITPSGDQVISGYFYADPNDFAYGSVYNPELFVKVYIASNGWANMAFNHVTVDPVSVYSAHQYAGSATNTGSATLTGRLVEHTYTGVAIDTSLQSSGESPATSTSVGYTISSGLWAKAWLTPVTGPLNLIWKAVGTDTTPSGDTVVSGYFYASPAEFAYGSVYNPELFVKVYIAANGWANMAFNHVTVDDVGVMSAHNFSGLADQTGTATLNGRLVEHQYTGVGLQ